MEGLPFPAAVLCYALSVWLMSSAFKNVVSSIKMIGELRSTSLERKKERLNREMKRLLVRIRHEVEPKFDLWWNVTGKDVIENYAQVQSEASDTTVLPEVLQDKIRTQYIDSIKGQLFSYAGQLASQQALAAHVLKVRRIVDDETADELEEKAQRTNDHNYETITQMGIDAEDFVSMFSSAPA